MKKQARVSRLAIGICVIAVVFSIFNVYVMNTMRVTAQRVYDHPYTVSNTARGMRSRLLDMKRFVGVFMTDEANAEERIKSLMDERYSMQNESIASIRERYLGPQEDVDALRYAMDTLLMVQADASIYAEAGHTDAEVYRYLETSVYPYYDAVEASLDTIISFADGKISELTDYATHMATLSIVSTFILAAAIVLLVTRSNRQEKRNIAALTAREHELEDALSLAETASNAKRDFLSRMSHDMRTPLNSVLGGVQLAKMKKANGQDTTEELELVEQSGQFLLSLINDILDVSRIEANRIELNKAWCSPKKALQTVVKIVSPMMEKKNLHFVCPSLDPAVEKIECYIDSHRMQQVLVNLLNNAAKFTPEGGTVTLTIKNIGHDDTITTDFFSVSDTGCGMSKAFISHIGEEFSQEQNEFSNQVTGSGLGLFIVKKIVEIMGGSLSVESELGKGTTISFTVNYQYRLKKAAAEKVEIKEEKSEEAVHLSGLRVLCAEDNAVNQIIIQQLLENEGINVTIATDGAEAVKTFERSAAHSFDAILMDVRMPVMSGTEATKAIRQLDRADARQIPIIAVSADAIQDEIERAMSWGFTEYLTKPIDPQRLYQTLERHKHDMEKPVDG